MSLTCFGNHVFALHVNMEVLPHGCTCWLKVTLRWSRFQDSPIPTKIAQLLPR